MQETIVLSSLSFPRVAVGNVWLVGYTEDRWFEKNKKREFYRSIFQKFWTFV
uniref:Uncharacterized protein n=1 Tax=Anguilla anguilla TaxID=7936 RepID=A0A0E9VP84_ANGAN